MDSGTNSVSKPEALPGAVNRLRAKVQRSQFPADRFGFRLPALTAFRPNLVDNVGQLPAEHLRSSFGVATKKERFQKGRSEFSRWVKVKILVLLDQVERI